jgi:Family of unknown function (DUF6159)
LIGARATVRKDVRPMDATESPAFDRRRQPTVSRGGWAQYARDGWALGGAAMGLVRRQPGLRRYVAGALPALLAIHIAVAAAVLHFRHDGTLLQRLIVVLVTGYLIAVLTNAAAVGLAGLSDGILSGRGSRAADGWSLATRRLPQVAGWAVLVLVVGVPARLVTSWGVDQLAAVLLGFGWGVVSFFAIPAIALTGAGPIRAAERSFRLVRRFWAGQVAGMVYVWLRPALFLGVPGAIALVVGVVLERSGADLLGWTLGVGGVIVLAIAYLVVVSARSILSVAIFRYAGDGVAPAGFDAERLERLMVGPTPIVQRLAGRLDNHRIRRLRARLSGSGTD